MWLYTNQQFVRSSSTNVAVHCIVRAYLKIYFVMQIWQKAIWGYALAYGSTTRKSVTRLETMPSLPMPQ